MGSAPPRAGVRAGNARSPRGPFPSFLFLIPLKPREGRRTALFSSWARHFAEIGHFVGHQGVFFLLFLLYRVVPSFFYNEEEMQGDFLFSLFVIRESLPPPFTSTPFLLLLPRR